MGVDPELLEKLVCPKCHGPLQETKDKTGLDCPACLLRYRVEKYGEVFVPNMIIEQAIDLRTLDGEKSS